MITITSIKNKSYLKEREEIFEKLSELPLPSERYTDLKKIPFEMYLQIKENVVVKDEILPEEGVIFFPEFFEDKKAYEIIKRILKEKNNRILGAHFVFPTGGFYLNLDNRKTSYKLNLSYSFPSKYFFQTYVFKLTSSFLDLKINIEKEGDYFSHNLFIFVIDKNSKVKIEKFVKSNISYLFNTFFVFLGRDSELEFYSAYFKNPYLKNDKYIFIEGEGSKADLKDIFLTNDNIFLSLRNDLIFRKSFTYGEEYSKGILLDKSTVCFYGLARVDENLKKINAFVEGDALLLSNKASFFPVPSLEILSNDLRCTHAVNSAPLPEEKIFYMSSRGLKREDAIRMYIESYLLSNISNASQELKKKIKNYLNSIEIK